MRRRPPPDLLSLVALLLVVAAASLACGKNSQETPPDNAGWTGEVQRNGQVTTVRSTSGAWDGKARLVEELSIGVEMGPDEYMFGAIRSVYATEEAIYVVDGQVPAIRAFDLEGEHIRDLGGVGQGPGEFLSPGLIAGGRDGRIVVQDANRRDLMIAFGSDGELLEPYRVGAGASCCTRPMVVLDDGSLWLELQRGAGRLIGMRTIERFVQRFSSEGPVGEPQAVPLMGFEPLTFRLVDIDAERLAPFSPEHVWALSPDGSLIVGVSSEYAFEIRHDDGSITRVVRDTAPVAVLDVEAEWHRKAILSSWGWSPEGERVNLDWNEEIPDTKPAFRRFVPAASGEIWVYREGPATPIPDCSVGPIGRSGQARIPPPCHETTYIVDAFEASGRYLGEVDIPEGFRLVAPLPFVRDDIIVAVVEDESGLERVKRFRLVTP